MRGIGVEEISAPARRLSSGASGEEMVALQVIVGPVGLERGRGYVCL